MPSHYWGSILQNNQAIATTILSKQPNYLTQGIKNQGQNKERLQTSQHCREKAVGSYGSIGSHTPKIKKKGGIFQSKIKQNQDQSNILRK